jgi:putative ABC transport system ATP-binding protein
MYISGTPVQDRKAYALELLAKVGIDGETAHRQVLRLSGGEQQRVGIARALSHDPDIIMADEPTGNLDSGNAAAIMKIFQGLAHDEGKCVIIVTHSRRVRDASDEVIKIEEGRLTQKTA